tara:strand:+ start:437 stop:1165 length:729 start_codon:yes stop_codon:yes gene_type:complete
MKEIRVDLSPKLLKRIEGSEEEVSLESWAKEEKSGKKLNKPFRTPKGPKKFSVYVKNEKGNVVKVNFGDPNMEIKRDDPARRKSFRARHNCENPGPKTKARYWSCKMWSNKSVTNVTKGSEITEEDFLSFLDESEAKQGLWDNIRKKKKRMGKNYKPAKPGDKDRPDKKAWDKAKGADDPNKHYFKTKEEALKDADKMGLKGFHTHKAEDGETLYMAGPNHESFMKKHKEMIKAGWHSKDKK